MDIRLTEEETDALRKLRADVGVEKPLHVVRALLRVQGVGRHLLVLILKHVGADANTKGGVDVDLKTVRTTVRRVEKEIES